MIGGQTCHEVRCVLLSCGVGAVFRDHCGNIPGGFCSPLSHVALPELAEALAAREACSYAIEHSFSPLIFESHSSSLVSATRDVVPHTSFSKRVMTTSSLYF